MKRNKLLALTATSVLATLGACTPALAAKVTVRVEGLHKTLLAPTVLSTKSGWITKDGVPAGECPASSANGALDVATDHHWNGIWYSSFSEYLITSIFGEHYTSSSNDYWSLWVNDRFASLGACEIKLHHGDQLLFAVEGLKTAYPIAIEGPSKVAAGHSIKLKVVYYDAAGHTKPLAGAHVRAGALKFVTDAHGSVKVPTHSTGAFRFTADHTSYIRSAPLVVVVS